MDHHDRMNAEAEESPSHLGHEMSPTSATPMSMEHDHRGMMEQDLRRRFFVVLVLTFPVLALSPTIQSWAGYRLPSLPAASLILAALASIITLYGGLPFFHGAGTALRARTADMDVLVSLAILSVSVQPRRHVPFRGLGLLLGDLDPRPVPAVRTLDGN